MALSSEVLWGFNAWDKLQCSEGDTNSSDQQAQNDSDDITVRNECTDQEVDFLQWVSKSSLDKHRMSTLTDTTA